MVLIISKTLETHPVSDAEKQLLLKQVFPLVWYLWADHSVKQSIYTESIQASFGTEWQFMVLFNITNKLSSCVVSCWVGLGWVLF